MSPKRWLLFLFLGIPLLTLGVGLLNYGLDPWQQYRKSVIYPVSYKLEHERPLNAGLAKHYPYRSIVIGTSMTENFLISEVAKLMPEPIKLSLSGGTAREMALTMGTAFGSRQIDSVLLGLDIYALRGTPDLHNPDMEFPVYLYDDHFWNDYPYLLSIDTLSYGFKALFKPLLTPDDPTFSYEHMYEFYDRFKRKYGQGKRLSKRWHAKTEAEKEALLTTNWSDRELIENFEINILPIIREHDETTFYIFYPPYSKLMVAYCDAHNLDDDIETYKSYVFHSIGTMKHVKLYDFQRADFITENLDNYKDIIHYDQATNSWMIEQMLNDRYRVRRPD